jgi:membrane protein YdbS with pleckstrin-like domain
MLVQEDYRNLNILDRSLIKCIDPKDESISIGFSGILFIVFLILKLTNVIAWSWWWVTAPLWITIALNILIIISIVLFQFIIHRKKRNKK